MLCKYHQHSVFHQLALYFIRLCLRVKPLREALFSKFGILEFIVVKATEEWQKPAPERKSYSGILLVLAQSVERMEFEPFVRKQLKKNKAWISFHENLYSNYINENIPYSV